MNMKKVQVSISVSRKKFTIKKEKKNLIRILKKKKREKNSIYRIIEPDMMTIF